MSLSSLIRDDKSGNLSHTKLWANIAYAAMTSVFIHMGWHGQVDAWWLFAYGAVVAGSGVATKLVALKYGSSVNEAPPS